MAPRPALPLRCGTTHDPDHVRLLLQLSSSSLGILHGSIALLFISGIVASFMGRWWNQGWIWLSLGLLIAIYIYMGVSASGYFGKVRKAVGLAYMDGFKSRPGMEQASAEEIDALLAKSTPVRLTVIGFGGLLLHPVVDAVQTVLKAEHLRSRVLKLANGRSSPSSLHIGPHSFRMRGGTMAMTTPRILTAGRLASRLASSV